MVLPELEAARTALREQHEAEEALKERQRAMRVAAIDQIMPWLDQLAGASSIPVKLTRDLSKDGVTVRIGSPPHCSTSYIHTRTYGGDSVTLLMSDEHLSLADIRERLCRAVAQSEWEQAQAIAKQLAGASKQQ